MEFLEKIDIRSWRNEVQRHLTKWSFFALGYALRSLRVQVSLPSFSQTLVNRSRDWSKRPFSINEPWELDSFPVSSRRKEKREMDPLGGAQNRFVCVLNESRLRIDHESFAKRKVNFFLGRRKSVSKDDDDQFYRHQFSILTANSVFASRFPVPKYERVCFRIAIVAG